MQTPILLITIASTFISESYQCSPSKTTASGSFAPKRICSGQLIFEDNFDTLNTKKWKHEVTLGGNGHWEFQWYTNDRANSVAENGILKIKPTLTSDYIGQAGLYSKTIDLGKSCTNSAFFGCKRTGTPEHIINPIRSAKLRTTNSFAFKYGRVEVRAKLPKGDWLWPAIWMIPKNGVYGGWPRSGEVDIMESRGNQNLTINGINIGIKQIGSTLHWGLDSEHNGYLKTHWAKNKKEFNQNFHRYEMLWTPDRISFKVDGEKIGDVTPPQGGFWQLGDLKKTGQKNIWSKGTKLAPFDKEFYLILNLAVGGVSSYFPDNAANPGGKPWSNKSRKALTDFWNGRNQWLPTWNLRYNEDSYLQVDYVRVYAL